MSSSTPHTPSHQSVSRRGVVLDGLAKFRERNKQRLDLKGRGKLPSYETPADPIMVAPRFPSNPKQALLFFRRISLDDPTSLFIAIPVPLLGSNEDKIEAWIWSYNRPLIEACSHQPTWREFGVEEDGLTKETAILRSAWRFNDPLGSLQRAIIQHFEGEDLRIRWMQLQANKYIYRSTTASLPWEKARVEPYPV